MRKYLVGFILAGMFGVVQIAAGAATGSGYLGNWIISTYVDVNGKTRGILQTNISNQKTTWVDRNGAVLPTVILSDTSCTGTMTTAFIELSDPAVDSVKREWLSIILIAETMKRPVTIVTSGCITTAASGAIGPKIVKLLLR